MSGFPAAFTSSQSFEPLLGVGRSQTSGENIRDRMAMVPKKTTAITFVKTGFRIGEEISRTANVTDIAVSCIAEPAVQRPMAL
eukprot:CAMPEP_0172154866 /NCGR_PEP_ID=MMETSP1050-20130122/2285_1 /TAXON_ID=233186 /ORGANISM="Cryptomonas curvata, Strain CCAP979/52" /LENGTH=82 /DNA_ID=CAMNT_0012823655 /DNA_START=978 /DNA_END=1226 /DNA_ORIENTATION=+